MSSVTRREWKASSTGGAVVMPRRPSRHLRSRLTGVPSDEVAQHLGGAARSATFGGWACGEERVPQVVRDADVSLRLAFGGHVPSLAGGSPVAPENHLRVGSHLGRVTSMESETVTPNVEQLPTLPGLVDGIVSLDPPQVQCRGCGVIATGDPRRRRALNVLILTCRIHFHVADGHTKRLCADCRAGCTCVTCRR